MKTSISSWLLPSTLRLLPSTLLALQSRSRRTVDAGRGATISAMGLTRRARLRLQIGSAVDPRHPRQQVIHFRLRGRGDAGAGLALRGGSNDATLLQHILAHREPRARLLLVADQRQMRVEQIVHGVALALLRQSHHI